MMATRKRLKKRELPIFDIKNMNELLQKLNLLEMFERSELTCFFCNRILTLENMGAILHHDGAIVFTCDTQACLQKALKEGRCLA